MIVSTIVAAVLFMLGVDEARAMWMTCSVRLQLPQYPPLARQARLTGTAVARIRLAADAKLADVKVEGVHRVLQRAVETSLRTSEFLPSCGGREFSLRYTFRIEGAPTDRDALSVALKPPDEIVVVTRPGVPMPEAND